MVFRKLRKGGRTAEAGKYTIVSLLCEHKDSTVWLAEHKALKVKRIIKGIKKTSKYHNRLVNEAHLLKNLKNPYIPEIYDLTDDDDYTYIIEQYIMGESLKSLCNKRLLSEKEILHFMIQFCNIINYLHTLPESILYLDLKPENIIISDDKCYLVDFGSAHNENDDSKAIFGTRTYASPEQIKNGKVSKVSDIYSLGKLLDFMLNHSSYLKNKQAFEKIISRCTANKIWHRISSVQELMVKINALRNQTVSFSNKPITIAFAGAESHSGTTYLALLFSFYIIRLGRKCTYVEANDSEAWYSVSPYISEQKALAELVCLSKKYYESKQLPNSDIILDYGKLCENMPEDFYRADITCIIIGNKFWEVEHIHKARALSQKCQKRLFLVNLADSISDYTAAALNREEFLAIPFISDFDSIIVNEEVKAGMQELAVKTGIYVF